MKKKKNKMKLFPKTPEKEKKMTIFLKNLLEKKKYG